MSSEGESQGQGQGQSQEQSLNSESGSGGAGGTNKSQPVLQTAVSDLPELPTSPEVLAEAGGPESLSELMSRDPLKLGSQDRARIVQALRADRARREAAAAEAESKGKSRGQGPKKVSSASLALTTIASVEGTGL